MNFVSPLIPLTNSIEMCTHSITKPKFIKFHRTQRKNCNPLFKREIIKIEMYGKPKPSHSLGSNSIQIATELADVANEKSSIFNIHFVPINNSHSYKPGAAVQNFIDITASPPRFQRISIRYFNLPMWIFPRWIFWKSNENILIF